MGTRDFRRSAFSRIGSVLATSALVSAWIASGEMPAVAEVPEGMVRVEERAVPGGAESAVASRSAVAFEPNLGQARPGVRFVGRARGVLLLLGERGAVLRCGEDAFRMGLVGASPAPEVAGGERLPGVSHYLIGQDRFRWVRGVPRVDRVHLRGVYPGVDMEWRGRGTAVEYAFRVGPGTDPGRIGLEFPDARGVGISGDGELRVRGRTGEMRHSRPRAWQVVDGRTVPVRCRFALREGGVVGFETGRHDPDRDLFIDPQIDFSTFFGAKSTDEIRCVAVDSEGSVVVAGET